MESVSEEDSDQSSDRLSLSSCSSSSSQESFDQKRKEIDSSLMELSKLLDDDSDENQMPKD